MKNIILTLLMIISAFIFVRLGDLIRIGYGVPTATLFAYVISLSILTQSIIRAIENTFDI